MRLILGILLAVCVLTACHKTENYDAEQFEYKEEHTQTIELTLPTVLVLENTNGTVEVTGSDTTNDMHLEITKKVRSSSLEDAEDHIGDIEITIDGKLQEVDVTVEHPMSTERDYEVDFAITLPTDLPLANLNLGNGDISVSSIKGDFVLALGNGSITLEENVSTGIAAELGNGDIDADVTLADSCTVSFGVGNGSLELTIPKNTNAKVEATVGLGEITYTGLTFEDLLVTGTTLEGILGEGKGYIGLHVGNGNIRLEGK
jgi:hypothetical protein